MEREYEFFVTTDEPQQPEGASRGLIRRLVMRNFFETKASNPGTTSSESNSASTVQSKTQLKSRFRLAKPGQATATPKASTRKKDVEKQAGKEEEGGKKAKRPATARKLSTKSDVSQSTTKSARSRTGSRKGSPVEAELAETSKEKPRLLLKVNPGAHRFDPFDVLPVPGTFQFDRLFKLYKNGSRANAIAVNARNTWWPFISQDAGLLHATLATWALYGMLVRGMDDLAVEKLRHKNEAIKQINTKIACPTGQMSDELVGTVLTLASFENLVGAYDAAQLHLQALKRIVDARGGLYSFGHNDGLIRGIIWFVHAICMMPNITKFP
ncbi:hypothetical protein BCR34DRAFT_608939 [Clohesyomyces aquaticus]|uniref:Uncharacterized protein n=1 Tax=Clohesyomyces aquaticus TaxID=1231657 RepID=A0A1Y1Y182_9PLEO|nr:hypothetical protein BCR34DRAFT_608939 [Clohesyomyces aquaticus]